MALQKGTAIYSIFKGKCPRCHEGDFFVSTAYDLKNTGKLHEQCSECGLRLNKEPGFYFGAMYVSYAFAVAIFVAAVVGYYLIFRSIDAMNLLIIIGIVSVVTAPWIYAYSKIIWINIFERYDKNAIANYQNKLKENEQAHSI